jgi:hypothetical protein
LRSIRRRIRGIKKEAKTKDRLGRLSPKISIAVGGVNTIDGTAVI